MKKIILIAVGLALVNIALAKTFKVTVTLKGSGTRVMTKVNSLWNYQFSCMGNCEGAIEKHLTAKPGQLHKEHLKAKHRKSMGNGNPETESGLKYQERDQFISNTGQVFSMTELILKYEKLIAIPTGDKNMVMTGRETNDLIYRLTKTENGYTIEIFTAEDAQKMESILNN